MNKSKYNCVFLAIGYWILIASCAGKGQLSVDKIKVDNLVEIRPDDVINDIPRTEFDYVLYDKNYDEVRAGAFNYKVVVQTEIKLQLSLFNISNQQLNKLSKAKIKANFKTTTAADAVVVLTDQRTQQDFFAAKIDSSGIINKTASVPVHINDVTMTIQKNGFETRAIAVDNFSKISALNRDISLLQTTNTAATTLVDTDGDTIADICDAFPLDPNKAFKLDGTVDRFYTVAFEDNFPNLGDGDYNDFVVRYSVTQVLNAQNQVVEINGTAEAIARAAGYDHRFGIIINFPGEAATLSIMNSDEAFQNDNLRITNIQDRADIIIWENTKQAFTKTNPNQQPDNPTNGAAKSFGHLAYFKIEFLNPVATETIDLPPYDPYLYVHNTGYDVHLIGEPSLPNSNNPAGSDGFLDGNGYPRALLVPIDWSYPEETRAIESAYPQFTDWRLANGQSNSNWYFYPETGNVVEQNKASIIFDRVITQGVLDGETWQFEFTYDGSMRAVSTREVQQVFNGSFVFDPLQREFAFSYSTVDIVDPECQSCGIISSSPVDMSMIPVEARGIKIDAVSNTDITVSSIVTGEQIQFVTRQGFGAYDEATPDNVAPVTTISPPTTGYDGPIDVIIRCTDDKTGCYQIAYTFDGTEPSFVSANGIIAFGPQVVIPITTTVDFTVKAISRDNTGNVEATMATASYNYTGIDYDITYEGVVVNPGTNPGQVKFPYIIGTDAGGNLYVSHILNADAEQYISVFNSVGDFQYRFPLVDTGLELNTVIFSTENNRIYALGTDPLFYEYDIVGNLISTFGIGGSNPKDGP